MKFLVAVLVPLLVFIISGVHAFAPSAPTRMARRTPTARSMAKKSEDSQQRPRLSRRKWLFRAVAAPVLLAQSVLPTAAKAADKFVDFEDAECGFKISIPSTWEKQVQELSDRRKIVLFVDPTSGKDKTLCFLAYTPVRDDFTQLASFGSVDQVAQQTILPKGAMAGQDNESAMLQAESKKNAYFFDYTAKTPGQPKTHFRTIFNLAQGATGGAGAVLVTITAQTPEERYGELKGTFDAMMDSYSKSK